MLENVCCLLLYWFCLFLIFGNRLCVCCCVRVSYWGRCCRYNSKGCWIFWVCSWWCWCFFMFRILRWCCCVNCVGFILFCVLICCLVCWWCSCWVRVCCFLRVNGLCSFMCNCVNMVGLRKCFLFVVMLICCCWCRCCCFCLMSWFWCCCWRFVLMWMVMR